MNHLLQILAQTDPKDMMSMGRQYFNSPRLQEVLAVSGTLFAAIVVAAVGAILYSKKKKRRRRYHHHHRRPEGEAAANAQTENSGASREGRRREKRRRRSERPMNPTLAQTGGLPPVRDNKPHLP
jgi:hypothetical protein